MAANAQVRNGDADEAKFGTFLGFDPPAEGEGAAFVDEINARTAGLPNVILVSSTRGDVDLEA